MSRSYIAILLIFALLSVNFTSLFVYAGFEMNQKYIASVLCENKAKPKMHCNGQCYLAKKIKQAEENEKKQGAEFQKNRFQEALITEKLKINYPEGSNISAVAFEQLFDLPQYSSSVFHPPQA